MKEPQSQPLAFAQALEWDLTPVGVPIFPETVVMSQLPRTDVLILQRQEAAWTAEQLERLPDGIRQSTARYILVELKYTQSISDDTIIQTLADDLFYRKSQNLTTDEVQTFLVCAIKPQQDTLKLYGYNNMLYPGVYNSQNRFEKRIQLISLNELADKPYNAVFKLFATHQKEKAFQLLEQSRDVASIPPGLKSLLSGLLALGKQEVNQELTPEQVRQIGQILGKAYLSTVPLSERLAGANPADVITHLKPKPGERLAGLSPDEIEELEFHLKNFKHQKH